MEYLIKIDSSSLSSLQVINDILPKLAKRRTDTLMKFCQDAQFKLEVVPTNTLEYVENLSFLDVIQEKVCAGSVKLIINYVDSLFENKEKQGEVVMLKKKRGYSF